MNASATLESALADRLPAVLDSLPSLALDEHHLQLYNTTADDFILEPFYHYHYYDPNQGTGHLSSDAPAMSYPYSDPVHGYAGLPLGKPRLSAPQAPMQDFQLFGDTTMAATAPSSYPSSNDLPLTLPDLIPDSPTSFSPPNPQPPLPMPMAYHSSAFQQHRGRERDERSSSVPLQTLPKPIRRRTQEFKDQQSLVSTLYGQQQGHLQQQHHPQQQQSFFAAPSSVSNSGSSNGWAPSTDHPLSIPEQQDLLDRVRRDLYGVDLDNIKGPLRALALSSTEPPPRSSAPLGLPQQQAQQQQTYQQAYAAQQYRQQQEHQQREREDMMRKTVSPQEAFLDYEDVDHRLHPTGSPVNLFGVGPSLFAPLPRAAVARTPPPPPPSASAPTTIPSRSSSPAATLSTSPRSLTLAGSARKPHPFAVPQNAVSWADKQQKSGDDGDRDGDESDDDEESEAGPSQKQELESSSDDQEQVIGQFDEDTRPAVVSHSRTSTATSLPAFLPPAPAPAPVTLAPAPPTTTYGFAPPAPAPSARPAPSLTQPAPAPMPSSTSHDHMRPSARRALDLLHHVNDPVGEDEAGNDQDAEGSADEDLAPPRSRARTGSARPQVEEAGDEEYQPTAGPSYTASGRPARSTAGRKRSRTPFAEDDSEAEEEDTSFRGAEEDSDSDAGPSTGTPSHRPSTSSSSTKKHRSHANSAPNKRRRRIPAASATTSSSSSAIRCPHVNDDATICGVVFRRPYDLARHRETIHGETPEGKVARKTEWVCKGCGGTFSRKDALIRHARIRGHKSGV